MQNPKKQGGIKKIWGKKRKINKRKKDKIKKTKINEKTAKKTKTKIGKKIKYMGKPQYIPHAFQIIC